MSPINCARPRQVALQRSALACFAVRYGNIRTNPAPEKYKGHLKSYFPKPQVRSRVTNRSRDIAFHSCQCEEGQLKIVVFGLSVTSSWGNGHATTYRAPLAALHRRKHRIVFFEKGEEWYASNCDLPSPEFCDVRLFKDWRSILPAVRQELRDCDVAVLGSFFPDGIRAGQELISSNDPVKDFYDIDTPITLKKLRAGGAEYLQAEQVAGFDLYLSFTAGPILEQLQREFGAQRALPL